MKAHSWQSIQPANRELRACNCIGPQDGQPVCPCMMRGVDVVDGRYVRIQDLGPIKPDPIRIEEKTCKSCGKSCSMTARFCWNCGSPV